MRQKRYNYTLEEKVLILKRHLIENWSLKYGLLPARQDKKKCHNQPWKSRTENLGNVGTVFCFRSIARQIENQKP